MVVFGKTMFGYKKSKPLLQKSSTEVPVHVVNNLR